jgi:hypothetical protein
MKIGPTASIGPARSISFHLRGPPGTFDFGPKSASRISPSRGERRATTTTGKPIADESAWMSITLKPATAIP